MDQSPEPSEGVSLDCPHCYRSFNHALHLGGHLLKCSAASIASSVPLEDQLEAIYVSEEGNPALSCPEDGPEEPPYHEARTSFWIFYQN